MAGLTTLPRKSTVLYDKCVCGAVKFVKVSDKDVITYCADDV
jgi:hypothetical protein